MAIVEVTIFPLGTNSTSVSQYVAGIHKILEKQDKIKYSLTPMSTILEGDLDEIFPLIRKMQESVFNQGAQRVETNIKIDDRRDKKSTMEQKIHSVKSKLD